jgi:hypothetical protein
MIMSGKKAATLREVRLIDIHGTRFYDIAYTHDDTPGQQRSTRVGAESVYDNPQPSDPIEVSYLMNVVTSVMRRP